VSFSENTQHLADCATTTNQFRFRFPKSGSLIRAEKIDKFESLEQAIQERYCVAPEHATFVDDDLLMEARDAMSAPFMKVVGMDKLRERQSNLKFTEDITICHSTINQIGKLPAMESLGSLCLQSSCIANWKVVNDLVQQIPSLRTLDLSFNRLQMPGIGEEFKLASLEVLILNSFGLSDWNDLQTIGKMCPNLKELSAKHNDIQSITDTSQETMPNLETLIISENAISDFEEVLKLSQLPVLKELLVNNNQIKEVKLPFCDHNERLSIFQSLETLNLRHNPIADEKSMFNELDKLPALTRLSYMNQKATDAAAESAYMDMYLQAVGMIEHLTSFNRSEVDKNQRNDSMYEMWKKFAVEWMKVAAEGDQKMVEFNDAHRCYPRLLKKYGSPDQLILQQNRKRVTTIEVQFKNVTNGKMYRKKVPLAMTTHTLYGLIYKIAALHSSGLDLKSFKLYYIDAYNNNIKVYLDNLSKSLDYYSLQNGDTIYIEK